MLRAGAAIVKVFAETIKVPTAASCVTVIVWAVTPVPETVTVADLAAVVGFAVAVNVSVALFEPLELLNVNQV